eukprot:COSAG06_NODE_47511_length_338_cov_1.702929_1_plen_50_part_01
MLDCVEVSVDRVSSREVMASTQRGAPAEMGMMGPRARADEAATGGQPPPA